MSVDNRLWGAPHIHGELLKLGFAVAQSTVAKYMAKKGDPSGQRWGTFLRNHMPHIAAMEPFVVPTIGFIQLYVLVIVRLARRELVWINVTAHPTAEWIAQQLFHATSSAIIIMTRAFIDRWTRMPHSIDRLSVSAPSHHSLSLADFITNIAESDLRYTQLPYSAPIAGQTLRKGHLWPRGPASFARPLPPKRCGLPRASRLAPGKVILAASTFRR
jgi:hypothetical protein